MGVENIIPLQQIADILRPPDWKDDLREGSFRGVPFKIRSHKFASGRHNVEHEFPSRDEGNTEDLGGRLPGYQMELYVLGDDYFDQRDALIKALDEEGSGELIHPYLGTKTVQVGQYSIQETVDEGRMCRFSVDFTNAGVAKFPTEATDAFQSIFDAADAILDAATAALEIGFSVINTPARVAQAAADLVDAAGDLVYFVAKKAGSSAQGVADVAFSIKSIQQDAIQIVRTPDVLAQRFKDSFALLLVAVEDFKTLANLLSEQTSSFAPEPVIGSDTPTVLKLKGNQLAFQNFIIAASIANQAKAAIQGNYLSIDEALNVKALLNRDIENLLLMVTDDDSFQYLKDLQVAVNLGLPPQNVGETISFTPGKTLPALVICQRLFGNIDKEMELLMQNKVRHPGFVPGAEELEVSSG